MRTIAPLLRGLAVAAIAAAAGAAHAHDYPTSERVIYVEACMRDHPGAHYEMLNKCSCMLDAIAQSVPYDDYVEMSTATNANSIGGERGSYIRDVPMLQEQIKKYKALQAQAQKSCFIQ
jgi:hypothetical protein